MYFSSELKVLDKHNVVLDEYKRGMRFDLIWFNLIWPLYFDNFNKRFSKVVMAGFQNRTDFEIWILRVLMNYQLTFVNKIRIIHGTG